ncbi:MAG: PDZ domain-containing protein [Gemmataceae bacterium]
MRKRSWAGWLLAAATPGLVLAAPDVSDALPKTKPYVGIALQAPPEAGVTGAWIAHVAPDSPAAKAGLRRGDVITHVNDKDIENPQAVIDRVAAQQPGDELTFTVMRDGQEHACKVTLGIRPVVQLPPMPSFPRTRDTAFLGVHIDELTPEMKDRLKVDVDHGAVVMDVIPDSPAAEAGLKVDDVITLVNDRKIDGPRELRAAVREMGVGKEVTLRVNRGANSMDIQVTLGALPMRLGMIDDLDGFRPLLDRRFMELPENIDPAIRQRFEELHKRFKQLEKAVPPTN